MSLAQVLAVGAELVDQEEYHHASCEVCQRLDEVGVEKELRVAIVSMPIFS